MSTIRLTLLGCCHETWQISAATGCHSRGGQQRRRRALSACPFGVLVDRAPAASGEVARLAALKARRDNTSARNRLEELKRAARGRDNLMPPLLNCVKAYVTEGEIMAALKEVFGVYREPILF